MAQLLCKLDQPFVVEVPVVDEAVVDETVYVVSVTVVDDNFKSFCVFCERHVCTRRVCARACVCACVRVCMCVIFHVLDVVGEGRVEEKKRNIESELLLS